MQDVLRGVKVVEVAQWWFAPSAAAILAEWGAEVVKIEHPLYGDPIRGLTTSGGLPGSYTVNFMLEQSNHGKRSIGLDIAKPEGRAILDELVGKADVFVTSFLPAVRRKLKLDVEDVRAINPWIIYARGHAAGDRGPEPAMPRPSFGDGISGLAMAGAVAGALFARERHGEPSVIDVSLLGTAAWVMGPDVVAAAMAPGGIPTLAREATMNPLSSCYRTADERWIWLAMLQSDRYWPELCERVGRPELISDQRFASAAARATNSGECMAELDEAFARHTLDEWRAKLAGTAGVWAAVQTATELLDDPQVVANGYIADVQYDGATHRLVAGPAQFDGKPPTLRPAPGVGEHTDEILKELGHEWDDVIDLKVAGVVN